MKLTNDMSKRAFNNLKDAGMGYLEDIQKLLTVVRFAVITEYHTALREELIKHNIDIGGLEMDEDL